MAFSNILSWDILLIIVGIFVFVSFLSGSYPALYLSSFMPDKVLKSATGAGKSKGLLRKVLVVFQFSISLIMIIGTLIVIKQQRYIAKTDLGFNQENVIIIPARDTSFIRRIPAFREEIIQNSSIEYVATANQTPTTSVQGKTIFNVDFSENPSIFITSDLNSLCFGWICLKSFSSLSGKGLKG